MHDQLLWLIMLFLIMVEEISSVTLALLELLKCYLLKSNFSLPFIIMKTMLQCVIFVLRLLMYDINYVFICSMFWLIFSYYLGHHS